MKIIKILTTAIVLLGVVFLSFSCSSGTTEATTTTRTANVIKGTLTNSITGTGNLAYSDSQDLAFEMAGYVEEILVNESESVTKGQELVKLDTSDWEDQIKTLEKALTSAQRSLVDAQTAVTTAERTVAQKQLAVQSAQLDLETAQYNLNQIADVKIAQDNVDAAKLDWDTAKALRANGESSITLAELNRLEDEYNSCVADLNEILAGEDTTIQTTVALQITKLQLAVQSAQMSLDNAQVAVTAAERDVTEANEDLVTAQGNVTDAQANLDEEKAKSPIITAPFEGFITDIKVEGGDEVAKGTIAMTIADPNQFEANIYVTENDIADVAVGGKALVSLDALSNTTYSATITEVAPTATVSSGVVNYVVVVKLDSLTPISTTTGTTQPSGMPTAPSGTATPVSASSTTSTTSEASLKEGMSATVEVIVEQKADVLYIPKKAITTQGPNSTVQVMNGTTTETRTVQTGMTDGTYTEITSGLNEGEVVVYSGSSSSSSSSSQGGPGMMMGGPGGF